MRDSEMNFKPPVEKLRSFLDSEDNEIARMPIEEVREELRLLGIDPTEFSSDLKARISNLLSNTELLLNSISEPARLLRSETTDLHPRRELSEVIGVIDTASMNSALSAVGEGRHSKWPLWDRESVLKVTYLLLHSNIKVLPNMGIRGEVSGPYEYVVSGFPEVEDYAPNNQDIAKSQTVAWLNEHHEAVVSAWQQAYNDASFLEWAKSHKRQFFVIHVKRHGSLFEELFVPYIARVLDCSPRDLVALRALSSDVSVTAKWQKQDYESEDSDLAEKAWLLAGMLRGKYYEFLAQAANIQLLPHPFRKRLEGELTPGEPLSIPLSDHLFTKMLIGGALVETSREDRIRTWISNIRTARNMIQRKELILPETVLESDAERFALDAAKAVGMATNPRVLNRVLDVAVSYPLPTFIGLNIAPWIGILSGFPVGTAIQQIYSHVRDRSVGDNTAAPPTLSTKRRFVSLGKIMPGRIECALLAHEARNEG